MLTKFFGVSGWIFGLISLIMAVPAYLESDSSKDLLYDTRSEIVWRQTLYFPIAPIFDGKVNLKDNTVIGKTILTIWNGGRNIIKEDDIRVPLRIIFKEGRLFDVKLFNSLSMAPDNFAMERVASDEIVIKWKAFDPGAAVQLALLHNGEVPSMSVSPMIGPKIRVNKFQRFNKINSALLIAGVLFGFLLSKAVIDLLLNKLIGSDRLLRKPIYMGMSYIIFALIIAVSVWFCSVFLAAYIGLFFSDMTAPLIMDYEY